MSAFDCVLTMIIPRAIEETFVDYLLEHLDKVIGYSITPVEARGAAVGLAGVVEEVRGRSRRVQIQTVLNREDAQSLLADLRAQLPNPEITYWLTPCIEFGRFQ